MKRNGKLVGVDMNRIARLTREAQARNYKAAGDSGQAHLRRC